jgi:hypothetical protein
VVLLRCRLTGLSVGRCQTEQPPLGKVRIGPAVRLNHTPPHAVSQRRHALELRNQPRRTVRPAPSAPPRGLNGSRYLRTEPSRDVLREPLPERPRDLHRAGLDRKDVFPMSGKWTEIRTDLCIAVGKGENPRHRRGADAVGRQASGCRALTVCSRNSLLWLYDADD